jgi:hypothetical protein
MMDDLLTEDPLTRVRDSNPVPDPVTPPPFSVVLAATRGPHRSPRTAPRLGALVPALGALAAIAVVLVALVVPGGHRAAPGGRTGAPLATPIAGMPGVVMIDNTVAAPSGRIVISLEQCSPCRTSDQRNRTWLLTGASGSGPWTLTRGASLESVAPFSGPNGWATGLTWARNGGVLTALYVSHDEGRVWREATTPSRSGPGPVSIGGGEVWLAVPDCSGSRCATRLKRGPASGNRLTPVAGAPPRSEVDTLAAASATTAYVDATQGHRETHLVTRDGGRSWTQLPRFCPLEGPDRTLTLDSPTSLWRFCWNGHPPVLLGRSHDGGLHWQSFHIPAPGTQPGPFRFQAASAQVAWEMSDHGDVNRISGGGAHSDRVWSRSTSQRGPVAGVPQTLTVLGPHDAVIGVIVHALRDGRPNGSYVVLYRTRDGGRTWTPGIVPLPAR